MKLLKVLIFSLCLGLGSLLNANSVWLLDDADHWSLIIQEQLAGTARVQIYEQNKQDELGPKFVFKSQGYIRSIYSSGNSIHVVFPKSVFKLNEEKKLQLIHKAPEHTGFVGPLSDGETERWILKDFKVGEYISWDPESNDRKNIAELKPYNYAEMNIGHTENGELFIVHPKLLEEATLEFTFLTLSSGEIKVTQKEVSNFQYGSYAIDSEGIWLLPKSGTIAMLWNGMSFSDAQLKPLPEPYERWYARLKLDEGTVYIAHHGEDIEIFLDETSAKLDQSWSEGTTQAATTESIFQQFFYYLLLILSFTLFIRWRTRFQQQMLEDQGTKLVFSYKPTPYIFRAFAFLLDFYFVMLPIVFIFNQIYNFDSELIQIQKVLLSDMSYEDQQAYLAKRIGTYYPMVLSFVMAITLYNFLMEKIFGASLGKLFFRMKVVSLDGSELTWKQLLLRALMKSLDFTFFPICPSIVIILVSPLRQSLGDSLAKTQVVIQTPD